MLVDVVPIKRAALVDGLQLLECCWSCTHSGKWGVLRHTPDLASTICNSSAVSVFFKELIKEFHIGYSDTAWISSILLAMLYGT
eukprot:g35264.t1